jgi:hypothetical protein
VFGKLSQPGPQRLGLAPSRDVEKIIFRGFFSAS